MAKRLLLAFIAAAAVAAPAVAQERQWSLDASGEDAYLVFGVPDTDDVGVSLWCSIESGEVNLFIPEASATLAAGKDVTVLIRTDDMKAEFKGRTEVNADAGVSSIEAEIPAGAPIFSDMMKSDRFHVKVASEENTFPLFDADLAGLMELCRKP